MKFRLFIVSLFSLLIWSCGPKVDKKHFNGEWKLTDLFNPYEEEVYQARKKAIDTMTVLDLGRITFWDTRNVDSVKALETEMLETERKQAFEMFSQMKFVVLNDSVFIRTSPIAVDTCNFKFISNNVVVVTRPHLSKGRVDTLRFESLTANEFKLKEPFLNSFVTSTYTKK